MDEHLDALEKENQKLREEIIYLKNELNQNTYKILFEATPDIVIQVTTEYKILICHIPGFPAETLDSLKGMDIFIVTPETLREKMSVALQKVFSSGEIIRYESEGLVLDEYRYYSNYLAPIKDENDTITSAYFISREITQQKLSEKIILDSERKLKGLFGSSQHLHILMDLDQKLVWFNKRATETSKILFSRALEVGLPMVDFLKQEVKATFNADFENSLKGEIIIYQRHYIIANAQSFYLEMLLQPVFEDSQLIGVSLVGVETTERKKNEEKLEKINRELVQHNQRLNQYSYIISHNLRGPIVTLLGLVSLFESNKESLFREELIGHIKTSTLHLDNIIKDLNTVLSQTGKDLNKTNVNLGEELQMVKDLLKGQIESAETSIKSNFNNIGELYTVKSFLQSILLNLMSNALKYKRKEVPLEISIDARISEEKTLCLSFTDNGLGIDLEKNKDKIFGIYKRFHPHIEGKGLGLHLVKTQVDLLGGEIEITSEVDKGTTFKIYLSI
jgi:signal transduction histidine kinase